MSEPSDFEGATGTNYLKSTKTEINMNDTNFNYISSNNEQKSSESSEETNEPKQDEDNFESYPKCIIQNEKWYHDENEFLSKQHRYLSLYKITNRHGNLFWIRKQTSCIKKLKKLLNTMEEVGKKIQLVQQVTSYKAN